MVLSLFTYFDLPAADTVAVGPDSNSFYINGHQLFTEPPNLNLAHAHMRIFVDMGKVKK
jgi:hypothetical protein